MKLLYTCPVCAYPEMTDPVEEGNICPCCGTEFGYDDDLGVTYRQLRQMWIERGCPWFSRAVPRPAHWDAVVQLIEGDLEFDAPPDERFTTQRSTNRIEGVRFEALVA